MPGLLLRSDEVAWPCAKISPQTQSEPLWHECVTLVLSNLTHWSPTGIHDVTCWGENGLNDLKTGRSPNLQDEWRTCFSRLPSVLPTLRPVSRRFALLNQSRKGPGCTIVVTVVTQSCPATGQKTKMKKRKLETMTSSDQHGMILLAV